MTRASRADNSDAVSLFPFLAVLLCTMGSLIVLLVVIARQSRLQAAQSPRQLAAATASDSTQSPGEEVDEQALDARLAELSELRDLVSQQLTDDRRRLQHWEAHMRRLAERMVELQRQAQQLAETRQGKLTDRAQAEAEDARLKQLIAEMRVELEKEKAEARSRPKSYAVVPYRGPNETYRRPIYIECRAGEVILQPEGIKFTKADFLSPMGPGNPLAKALRAAAEYHSSHDRQSIDTKTGDDQQEAYPLILVRPDGAELYGGVRNAIRSWGSRFGYEMIEQDWELSFPPPNPELAALEQRAASESRAMRAHVARSRPRHAARPRHIEGAVRFSATSSSGGFRREGGGQQHDWVDHGFGAESFSAKQAKATQFGTSGDARVRKSDPARNDMDKPENLGDEQRDDTHPSNDKPKQIGPAGSPSGNSTEGTDAAGSQTGATGGTAVQALSSKRGAGWARAKSRSGTVPINRPIHIVCRADRFVILATGRFANFDVKDLATYRAASKNVVRLHGETVKAIDKLVAAIHDHTNSWGIAGKNLYWQPSLVLHVAPDGEGRASDLEVLLKDGGLEVTRAQGGQR